MSGISSDVVSHGLTGFNGAIGGVSSTISPISSFDSSYGVSGAAFPVGGIVSSTVSPIASFDGGFGSVSGGAIPIGGVSSTISPIVSGISSVSGIGSSFGGDFGSLGGSFGIASGDAIQGSVTTTPAPEAVPAESDSVSVEGRSGEVSTASYDGGLSASFSPVTSAPSSAEDQTLPDVEVTSPSGL